MSNFLTACSDIATGSGAYIRECFHEYESWKSCSVIHSHDQGYGALLLCCPICNVFRGGANFLFYFAPFFMSLDHQDWVEMIFFFLISNENFIDIKKQSHSIIQLGTMQSIIESVRNWVETGDETD